MRAIEKITARGYKEQPFKRGNRMARYDIDMAQKEAATWRVSGFWAQIVHNVSGNYLYIKDKSIKNVDVKYSKAWLKARRDRI